MTNPMTPPRGLLALPETVPFRAPWHDFAVLPGADEYATTFGLVLWPDRAHRRKQTVPNPSGRYPTEDEVCTVVGTFDSRRISPPG